MLLLLDDGRSLSIYLPFCAGLGTQEVVRSVGILPGYLISRVRERRWRTSYVNGN